MYVSYFGLREHPFHVTPDPRFFYANPIAQEAYANLLYGIQERKGFLVLTGEVGTGKTTLLRRLMNELEGVVYFAFFYNTNLAFDEILSFVCEDFGLAVVPHTGRLQKIHLLNEFLLTCLAEGKTGVLLIDEAQNLSDEALENLRLLSNLETSQEKLLQIVLVGQPELETKLTQPHLRQLKQRIVMHCRLGTLKAREVGPFIEHRLRVAGCQRQDLFAPEAIRHIAIYSKGIPRLINVICDNALLLAYATSHTTVVAKHVEEAARDLELISTDRVRQWRTDESPVLPPPEQQPAPQETGVGNGPEEVAAVESQQSNSSQFVSSASSSALAGLQDGNNPVKREAKVGKPLPAKKNRVPRATIEWPHPSRPQRVLRVGLAALVALFLLGMVGVFLSSRDVVERSAESPPQKTAVQKAEPPSVPANSASSPLPEPPPPGEPQQRRTEPPPPNVPAGKETPLPPPPVPALQEQPSAKGDRSPPASSAVSEEKKPVKTSPPGITKEVNLAALPLRDSQATPAVQGQGGKPQGKLEQPRQSDLGGQKSGANKIAAVPPRQAIGPQGEGQPRKREEARLQLEQRGISISELILFDKAENGDASTLNLLLNAGVSPNAKDAKGWTALMMAAMNGHAEVTHALLSNGAEVNARNSAGGTALMLAAIKGHTAILQELLKNGADVKTRNQEGWTPLMYAAWNGHTAAVTALLDKGAEVDGRNQEGWTPLMCAVWNGRTATVQALLSRGADARVKNSEGETAFTIATHRGNPEVVQLLKTMSADR